MSQPRKPRKKQITHFWRACRYLLPYRGMVIISVLCALFVGLTTTGGLGTMLPIMRVLINGDTVQGWVYRQNIEQRFHLKMQQEPLSAAILQVNASGPAREAGLHPNDVFTEVPLPANRPPTPFHDLTNPALQVAEMMRRLAWTDREPLLVGVNGRNVAVHPDPSRFYMKWAMAAAEMLPVNPVQSVAAVFGILAGLAIVGNGVRFFQEYLSDKAAILAVNDMRRQLYDRVLHVPLSFFGAQGTSDVTSRLVSDSANLQEGFKSVLGQSIQEPIKAAMALGLALILSWRLTLFIVAFGPLMAVLLKMFGKKMRRASRAALQSSSSMLGQVEGTLLGIRVVKAASAERFERRRYMGIMDRLVDEQLRMSRIDAFSAPTLESLTMLVAGVVVIYAAYLVLVARTLKPEVFILVMVSLAMIGESLRRSSKVNNTLQKANAAAERIFETMDLPVERQRSLSAGPRQRQIVLAPIRREITFENVRFRYPGANLPALDGVSLTVPKGRSIAIVGRNGSGKTTLLALLARFYQPESGRIAIDGIDLQSVTLPSLRRQISIVTQDSVIFPGTIAENIAYGNALASRAAADTPARRQLLRDIEDAAHRAFAHDFIMEKPLGYLTQLGELGGQLSGGQKQRLCIARAILRKSPILILDEATSQVDAESEHLIQKAIETLMHERTTFVIAHRFSTILSADTIVVLERGTVAGQGKHNELLANCPTYVQLYERQLLATAG